MSSLERTDKEMIAIYDRHVDTVYQVCYSYMRNRPETEDMVQETFLRLLVSKKSFESERHEKAWLIVTASNLCKDSLKKAWRKEISFEDDPSLLCACTEEHRDVLEAVLQLPRDYKVVVYMYYYEGYSTAEIAAFLKKPHATVRSHLSRARKLLKTMLGGEPDETTANLRRL